MRSFRREQYRDEAKRRDSVGDTIVVQGSEKKPIEDFISDVSEGAKEVEDQLSVLESKNNIRNRIHTYGFALCLFFLFSVRGFAPLSNLINLILKK